MKLPTAGRPREMELVCTVGWCCKYCIRGDKPMWQELNMDPTLCTNIVRED